MRFSVVINTYNRGRCLRRALRGLEQQNYDDFEVVIVNGPSTDETDAVLADYDGRVRVGTCEEINISKSRNIGISLADGEVVVFLDDDALPEPNWLSRMAAAYDRPLVGAVGGFVYDFSGVHAQFRTGVCDRLGEAATKDVHAPWAYQLPGADPFPCMLGANSSVRRACLLEIGGFDEEYEYYLDETDVCVRLNDLGYEIRWAEDAIVHHHFQASHVRSAKRIIRHPYPIIKNKLYFSLINGRGRYSDAEILRDARALAAKHVREHATLLSPSERRIFMREIRRGLRDGWRRGLQGRRPARHLDPAAGAGRFLPFPTRRPAGRKLCVCLVSQDYPPLGKGGIARRARDLAIGLADIGHEVHVITRAERDRRVEYDEGVWVHKVELQHHEFAGGELPGAARHNLRHAAAVHREIERIGESRTIDIVEAPIWDSEGLFCQLDDRLRTVLSLHTTAKVAAALRPAWGDSPDGRALVAAEKFVLEMAGHVWANSHATARNVARDFETEFDPARLMCVYLGIRDRAAEFAPKPRHGGPVRVLFVGRLEHRKGIDTFLDAAALLVEAGAHADFVIVGDDTIRERGRSTYRDRFETAAAAAVAKRVHFTGPLNDDELDQHYAECDVFCAPSRYESFGLIYVEAMMFGKPVVATAVGGIPEVVISGETGLLVPPDDPAALAGALRCLIDDPQRRRVMGAAGRERFLRHFTAARMAADVSDSFEHIAEGALDASL